MGPFTGGQLAAIIVALAVVVGLPMIASAAIPNGNTFNACTNKKTGALRLIDTSKKQKCNSTTETAVSWSKTGLKGATGAPGVPGPQGATGASGSQGAPGAAGAPGSARAYALVESDGTVVAARSKNIAVTKLGGTGGNTLRYCVDVQGGIDPTTVAPQLTPVYDANALPTATLLVITNSGSVTSLCGAPTNDFLVQASTPSDFTLLIP